MQSRVEDRVSFPLEQLGLVDSQNAHYAVASTGAADVGGGARRSVHLNVVGSGCGDH